MSSAAPINRYYCTTCETENVMFNGAPSVECFCGKCLTRKQHRLVKLKGQPDSPTTEPLFTAPVMAKSIQLDASVSAELPTKSPTETVRLDVTGGSFKQPVSSAPSVQQSQTSGTSDKPVQTSGYIQVVNR